MRQAPCFLGPLADGFTDGGRPFSEMIFHTHEEDLPVEADGSILFPYLKLNGEVVFISMIELVFWE